MKSYLLTIAILCLLSTGCNLSVNVQDDFNSSHLKQSESLSTDLAQNIDSNPQNAEDYYNRGLLYKDLGKVSQYKKDFEMAASLFQQQGNIQMYQEIRQVLQQL